MPGSVLSATDEQTATNDEDTKAGPKLGGACMNSKNGFTITNRDRVLRAWQNSTELVRDYQDYAH